VLSQGTIHFSRTADERWEVMEGDEPPTPSTAIRFMRSVVKEDVWDTRWNDVNGRQVVARERNEKKSRMGYDAEY
jgi:hypothetical protein